VGGRDQKHEVLAQPREAAQQVLALLAEQFVVGLPDGAVAAQPSLGETRVGMPQDRQQARQPAQTVGQQLQPRQVRVGRARLRVVRQGSLDRGQPTQRLARRALLAGGLGRCAVALDDAQAVGLEDAKGGVEEIGGRVVEAPQRGPLLAQHVGVIARFDGQVGQLAQRDRAEAGAAGGFCQHEPLVFHPALFDAQAVVEDREFHLRACTQNRCGKLRLVNGVRQLPVALAQAGQPGRVSSAVSASNGLCGLRQQWVHRPTGASSARVARSVT
jgi:hypothetical protein